MKGDGVLETFFGLLHLTWSRLDAEHQLAKKLGLDSDKFLAIVAVKLGSKGNVEELSPRLRRGLAHVQGLRARRRCGDGDMSSTPAIAEPARRDCARAELHLEDLVNREALTEMLKSFYALFGIPLTHLLRGEHAPRRRWKEHEVLRVRQHAHEGARRLRPRRRRSEGARTGRDGRRDPPVLHRRRATASSPSSTTAAASAASSSARYLPATVDAAPPSLLRSTRGSTPTARTARSS